MPQITGPEIAQMLNDEPKRFCLCGCPADAHPYDDWNDKGGRLKCTNCDGCNSYRWVGLYDREKWVAATDFLARRMP
jgi:hypothetical protein